MVYRNLSPTSVEPKCSECLIYSTGFETNILGVSMNLSVVREQVKEIVGHCSFLEKDLFELLLAVGEAVANAIEHGSPQRSENTIVVTVNCDSALMKINVVDQGNFIRRVQISDDNLDFRGRGIPLMLALMDKVVIDESETGTRVVLEKKVSNVEV